jgi:PAS domain S-box-containing protein
MRAYVQRLLERRFTIVTARDGQEALDYLRQSPVDLLLADVMMPRLDGFSLLSQVRADAALRELPVVLLSARAGEEAKIEGLDVGADDYLVKPFSARELLARVTSHLSLARVRREAHAAVHAADRRLRVALDSSNIGFALLKSVRSSAGELRDFEYVDLNSAGARLLGRPRHEFVGRSMSTLFPGIWHTSGFLDLCSSIVVGDEPKQMDVASETIGAGSGRWFQIAAARFDDGLAVWFTDITDRKEITLALEKSRHELERVTDVASVMLARCDRRYRYLFVNRAYASRFGLQPADVVGRRIVDVVGAQAFAVVEPHIRSVLAGNGVEFEMLIPDSDRGSRFVHCVYAPDIDALSGEVTGFVAAITDISERRCLEDRLRDADRRKDEFLATLAHELRNPLAPIRHAAAVATLPGASPDQVRRSHSVIDRQVRHMAVLLDDLLDISRITQGKLQLRLNLVNLQDVVDAAVEAARPVLLAKNHRLSVAVPPYAVRVNADNVRLAQILSNLLNNAAKYTDPGGLIRLSVTTEAQEVVIRVADNGVGIASEALPTLFTMFSQVKSALDRAEGGLGIGLSLVKGLVELHGGSVGAQSRGAGLGSEFVVRLPAPHGVRAANRSAPSFESPAPKAARRILVADDNRDSAETLQMLLSIDGHDVRLAYDGDQAVEVAGDFDPELIFVDIGMPKRNGYEVAQCLRERYPGRRMRLIALSGWGQIDDKRRAHASGFDRHLTKPVDPEVIKQIVNEMRS